jgi:hypothetical protein
MPAHHRDDELPSLATADLACVTGGAGDAMSSMLPMMMMMMMRRSAGAAAAAAPAPQPAPAWKPKILVDGVEQPLSSSANGTTFTSEV